MSLDRVSQNCLRGEEPPDDLRQLWTAVTRPWEKLVAFTLIEQLDEDFFVGYRESDGVSPNAAAAYAKMFDHIAFVGKREDGELVGYWLGPEGRSPANSPVIELDTEGQFNLEGRNLAEYLLACVYSDDDFAALRSILSLIGLPVAAETQPDLFDSFDGLHAEFGSPNKIVRLYEEGKDAPPLSDLPLGRFAFPEAEEILQRLGLTDITAELTKKDVIRLLGKPTKTGGDYEDAVLGYQGPWIKYHRPDCQLHIEFEKRNGILCVTVMEADWQPGD